TGAAHLPHQPFKDAVALFPWHQPVGLLSEIDQDRAGFHQMQPGVAIDDGGNFVVGTDLEKVGRELLALADVDGMRLIGQREFLECNGNFSPIGRGPSVKIDHVLFLKSKASIRHIHYSTAVCCESRRRWTSRRGWLSASGN